MYYSNIVILLLLFGTAQRATGILLYLVVSDSRRRRWWWWSTSLSLALFPVWSPLFFTLLYISASFFSKNFACTDFVRFSALFLFFTFFLSSFNGNQYRLHIDTQPHYASVATLLNNTEIALKSVTHTHTLCNWSTTTVVVNDNFTWTFRLILAAEKGVAIRFNEWWLRSANMYNVWFVDRFYVCACDFTFMNDKTFGRTHRLTEFTAFNFDIGKL